MSHSRQRPCRLSSSTTTLYSAGRPHRGQKIEPWASRTGSGPSHRQYRQTASVTGIVLPQKKSSSVSFFSVFRGPSSRAASPLKSSLNRDFWRAGCVPVNSAFSSHPYTSVT